MIPPHDKYTEDTFEGHHQLFDLMDWLTNNHGGLCMSYILDTSHYEGKGTYQGNIQYVEWCLAYLKNNPTQEES